jgi:hypothetical protein
MENKPSVDFDLLAPILLGIVSIAGITLIFWGGFFQPRPAIEAVGTSTSFRYIFIGTEPGLSTLTPVPTPTRIVVESSPFPTRLPARTLAPTLPPFTPQTGGGSSFFPTRISPSLTPPPFPTDPSFATKPASSLFTPTFTPTIPAVLAKYDDTYFGILYDGEWTSQTNVSGAYQNTLHISFTIENYALFTFVGQQVILTYQAGPSLGTIRIDLDGIEFEVSQASPQTQLVDWASPILILGTHDLVVEHLSGGSVNIDSVTIPDIRTATPTP